jgi:hypothetical protein
MSQASPNSEAGINAGRIEFVREEQTSDGDPIPPQDPAWEAYSDVLREFSWTPGTGVEPQRGLTDADPRRHEKGPEEHSMTVMYDLQRPVATVNITDPSSASALGVASGDAGDTNIDVTIYNDDESVSETITTDGSDGTTFVTGSTQFETVGYIEVGSSHAGTITVSVDNSGSPGDTVATLASGTTELNDTAANDAAYDGIARNRENKLPNSHTAVQRQDLGELIASNTVNGSTAKRSRLYTVGIGGAIDEAEVTGDPGEAGSLVQVTLTYEFTRGRSYQVDQPDGTTTLDVVSSDANDTTQTVVIESDAATTAESVSLNGTTTVTTSASFGSIDAVYVTDGSGNPVDHVGDITVSETGGDALVELLGSSSYDDIEGDEGIPALGTGSHAGTVGSSFEKFLGDTVTDAGSDLAFDINSFGVTVSNNTERTPRDDSFAQRVHEGPRDTEITATVAGETETHGAIMRSLQVEAGDIVWEMDGNTFTFPNAVLTDPGERSYEAEQAVVTPDNTFSSEGVELS